MLIPSCTQRSRKRGGSFPAHFFEVFSGFHLGLHIQTPQFDQLGQNLIVRPFLEVRRLQEKEQKWYSGMLGVTFNAEEGRITIFRSTLEALGWSTHYRFLYKGI